MTQPPVEEAFERLAPPLQRWLWEQGWSGLRPAQAEALAPILEGRQDVVIAVYRVRRPRFGVSLENRMETDGNGCARSFDRVLIARAGKPVW